MKRSLVQHGPSTLMISLPSKWLKKRELKRGEEVNLEEEENNLIIGPSKRSTKKEFGIKITNLTESSVRTILTNLYRIGYDKITVDYPDAKAVKIIEKVVKNNLIGFEMISNENNKCIIENITEPTESHFENIFSKMFLNIDSLFDLIHSGLGGNYQEFESTERQIQAFDNFCRRVMTKYDYAASQLRWSFHTELVHAQRELYLALSYISKNNVKSESCKEILKETQDIFENLKKAYNEKDIQLLEKIHEMEKEIIYDKGYNAISKSQNKNEKIVIHHLLSAVRNFYLSSSPLMGLFMII